MTDNLRESSQPASARPRRSSAQMEEIVTRLVSVPRPALEHALAAALAGLAELERTGDHYAGYRIYFAGLEAYLDGGGVSQDLRTLEVAEVAGAFEHGADAVRQKMYELGWTHE